MLRYQFAYRSTTKVFEFIVILVEYGLHLTDPRFVRVSALRRSASVTPDRAGVRLDSGGDEGYQVGNDGDTQHSIVSSAPSCGRHVLCSGSVQRLSKSSKMTDLIPEACIVQYSGD